MHNLSGLSTFHLSIYDCSIDHSISSVFLKFYCSKSFNPISPLHIGCCLNSPDNFLVFHGLTSYSSCIVLLVNIAHFSTFTLPLSEIYSTPHLLSSPPIPFYLSKLNPFIWGWVQILFLPRMLLRGP